MMTPPMMMARTAGYLLSPSLMPMVSPMEAMPISASTPHEIDRNSLVSLSDVRIDVRADALSIIAKTMKKREILPMFFLINAITLSFIILIKFL